MTDRHSEEGAEKPLEVYIGLLRALFMNDKEGEGYISKARNKGRRREYKDMEPKILEDLRKFVKVPTRATDFRIRPSRCRYNSDAHPGPTAGTASDGAAQSQSSQRLKAAAGVQFLYPQSYIVPTISVFYFYYLQSFLFSLLPCFTYKAALPRYSLLDFLYNRCYQLFGFVHTSHIDIDSPFKEAFSNSLILCTQSHRTAIDTAAYRHQLLFRYETPQSCTLFFFGNGKTKPLPSARSEYRPAQNSPDRGFCEIIPNICFTDSCSGKTS